MTTYRYSTRSLLLQSITANLRSNNIPTSEHVQRGVLLKDEGCLSQYPFEACCITLVMVSCALQFMTCHIYSLVSAHPLTGQTWTTWPISKKDYVLNQPNTTMYRSSLSVHLHFLTLIINCFNQYQISIEVWFSNYLKFLHNSFNYFVYQQTLTCTVYL